MRADRLENPCVKISVRGEWWQQKNRKGMRVSAAVALAIDWVNWLTNNIQHVFRLWAEKRERKRIWKKRRRSKVWKYRFSSTNINYSFDSVSRSCHSACMINELRAGKTLSDTAPDNIVNFRQIIEQERESERGYQKIKVALLKCKWECQQICSQTSTCLVFLFSATHIFLHSRDYCTHDYITIQRGGSCGSS